MLLAVALPLRFAHPQGPPPVGATGQTEILATPLPRCQGAPQCLPSFIARLKHAPFPIGTNSDGEGGRFFGETERDTGLRVRVNRHGDRYPEHLHYSDPSVLFHVPPGFDPAKPFRLLVFFHGHSNTLERDVVRRIRLTQQVDISGANVILIAPQLAKDAIDSHPGKLIREGALARMLDEAAGVLGRALGRGKARRILSAPVVLASYSGGYRALAAGLADETLARRVEGIILLDTVFGEVRRIDNWLKARAGRVFVAGLYSALSARWTVDLMYRWEERSLGYGFVMPARIGAGTVFMAPVATDHEAIASDGPPAHPLASILERLAGPQR